MRIDLPRITGGTDREKIAQIKSYLYQLVPQLQFILGDLEKTFSARLEALEGTNTANTATARKSTAEVHISRFLPSDGWYKVGTISGDSCALVSLVIGGKHNPLTTISTTVVKIATEQQNAQFVLEIPPTDDVSNCIKAVGLVADGDTKYGLYLLHKSPDGMEVDVSVHTHMGLFEPAWLASATETPTKYKLHIAEE